MLNTDAAASLDANELPCTCGELGTSRKTGSTAWADMGEGDDECVACALMWKHRPKSVGSGTERAQAGRRESEGAERRRHGGARGDAGRRSIEARGDAVGGLAHSSETCFRAVPQGCNSLPLDVVSVDDDVFSDVQVNGMRWRGAHAVHSNGIGNVSGDSEQVSSGMPKRSGHDSCGGRTGRAGVLYAHRESAPVGFELSSCAQCVNIFNSPPHSRVADLTMQGRRRRSVRWRWSSGGSVHTHASSVGACMTVVYERLCPWASGSSVYSRSG